MRKFLVYFRIYQEYSNYTNEIQLNYTKEIVLNYGEKANVKTFENKLNDVLGAWDKEIFAWSLIEE